MFKIKQSLVILFIGFLSASISAQSPIWQDITLEPSMKTAASLDKDYMPKNARTLVFDAVQMRNLLWEAPDATLGFGGVIVDIPLTDGSFERYEIREETGILGDNLYPKYGNLIKAFSGKKIGDPTTNIRITLGVGRFNSVIYRSDGTMEYVEELYQLDGTHYMAYKRGDAQLPILACAVTESIAYNPIDLKTLPPTGLRQYDIILTCSGEFSTQFGGATPTDASVQAMVTMQINNILNPIYKRDFGIVLVNVTPDEAIFLDDTTDPFEDVANSLDVLYDNAVILNPGAAGVIANLPAYDIGHAQVYANSGGVAQSSGVCDTDTETHAGNGALNGQQAIYKAEGMSGIEYPLLNDFTVDYVAHEIGHQFGCNHTYATVTDNNGNCDTGEASARYEVGSGTTIMGYVGVCADPAVYPDNKTRSDPFFHQRSIEEVVGFQAGGGAACGTTLSPANTADPVPTSTAATMTIPKGTPFVLVGTVTDNENQANTLAAWNQFDLAANNYDGGDLSAKSPTTVGPPLSTNTTGPLFRFQIPTAVGAAPGTFSRILPSNAMTGGTQTWEVLPTVARTLTFRLLARDDQSTYGRTANFTKTVTVTNDGPMAVTTPATQTGGASGTIAYSGLPTTACNEVDVYLSTDSGASYPTALATNVTNNGSIAVTWPNVSTSTARVLIQCHTTDGALMSSCTAFQVSSTFSINMSLPVELTDIQAATRGEMNVVNWATATEINNAGFEIQRSENAQNWETLDFVKGNGTTNEVHQYEWLDKNPLKTINYYRLRQVDEDGAFEFSKIVDVTRILGNSTFSISPNPNQGAFTINLPAANDEIAFLQIYSLDGKMLFDVALNTNSESINLTNLVNGVYLARLKSGKEFSTQKFQIQR